MNNERLYQALQAAPVLVGTTSIATNDPIVVANRKDNFIAAASTNTAPATPAFIRAGTTVTFDFYLLGGNRKRMAGAVVTITFPVSTGIGATGVTAGNLDLDEPIATALVAAGDPLTQAGRRVKIRADANGRVTGTRTITTGADFRVLVEYMHIQVNPLVTTVAS